MRAILLAVALTACITEDPDTGSDTPLASGKLDGTVDAPSPGTFVLSVQSPGLTAQNRFEVLALHDDMTFVRRNGADQWAEGRYQFTAYQDVTYIRFLSNTGALIDRYAFAHAEPVDGGPRLTGWNYMDLRKTNTQQWFEVSRTNATCTSQANCSR